VKTGGFLGFVLLERMYLIIVKLALEKDFITNQIINVKLFSKI
jgi:hypothetical protein